MKELLTIRANMLAAWEEGKKLVPMAEVVLVMTEPAYSVDGAGEVVRKREPSHCRFCSSPKTLRALAKSMMEVADEVEGLVEARNSASPAPGGTTP